MKENKNIEIIKNKDVIVALIIRNDFHAEGVNFFSPKDFPQQLGFISRKKGEIIEAHIHNVIKREIHFTQEILIIKKGKIKVNFYDSRKNYFDSRILNAGDVILIADGGHGFEILEDVEMIEVKQGPYLGESDKTRFKGIEK